MLLRWMIVLVLGFSSVVFAEEEEKRKTWLFFGSDTGYVILNSDQSSEENKDGWQLGFKVTTSYFPQPFWVTDLGIGWFYNHISSSDAAGSIKINTTGGYLEFSPRIIPTERFQVGLVSTLFFGDDVSFSEKEEDGSLSLALGVRANAELPSNEANNRFRLGAQFQTDLTISDRQIWWFQFDFQFGLPI